MTHPVQFGQAILEVDPEVLKPDLDVSVSGWEGDDDGTTDLHDYVNDDLDSSYVRRQTPSLQECSGGTDNFAVEFGIENPTEDPTNVDTVVVRVRARYALPFGGGGEATMRIRLRENTTTIATRSGISLTTSFVWYDDVLSDSEIDSVGDWTNLRILADADVCVDSVGDEINFEVAEMELDIN